MGRIWASRSGRTQPRAHDSTRRESGADGRLDPVRRRRPGSGTLIRLAAVAALLATAAAVSWAPPSCAPPTGVAAVSPSATAAAPRTSIPPGGRSPADPPGNGSRADPSDGSAAASFGGSRAVPSGSVGVPIRLADPTALAVVRPGDRVDLLRLDSETGGATAVATAALVLSVAGAGDPTMGGLLLALTPTEARQAVATSGRGFAILIRPS